MSRKIIILVQTIIKVFITLFLIGSLSAQSLLNRTIELKKDSYRSEELVKELQEVHSLSIGFGKLPSKEIQFSTKQMTLREALDQLVKDTNFTYQLLNNKVLIVDKGNQSGRATINGYIKDEETGEALIGATIYDKVSGSGVVSNNYGFYSLTLPAGIVDLHIQYLGFEDQRLELTLYEDFTNDFVLPATANVLEEVTVEGSLIESIEVTPQMSSISLSARQVENIPMVLGEHDILKAIQLLPGIQGGTEGSSGIYVRGGGPDQNLILLDGVPVYNTSHLFGFFSVFNGDAVNNIEVIKGGFPARYGGRLSSVIDISMKEGNNKKLMGKASVGLISSKVTIEGPIKNDKTTFIVSGRRSYFDIVTKPFDFTDNFNYYFYDFNAKINHQFSKKDRVFLSFYGGSDHFTFASNDVFYTDTGSKTITTNTGINWGNVVGIARWNHIFSPKLFGAFSSTYSRFRFNTNDERYSTATEDTESLDYVSGINDYAIKSDFEYSITPEYILGFGASFTAHRFNTGVVNLTSEEDNVEETGRKWIPAKEYSTYVENDFEVLNRIRFNIGLHASGFDVDGRFYTSIQPRLSGRLLLNKQLSIKASYAEMRQFIHLLTNSGAGLPTDLWVPATSLVEPQRSQQTAVGIAKIFKRYEISIEGYYKDMENLIEYENGASYLNSNSNWETKVESGDGNSRGVELLIQKNEGKLTGWLGYTLSKTTRQFDELNFGKEFFYKYDRRHDVSFTGTYHLSESWKISNNWVFSTGNLASVPLSKYLASGYSRYTANENFASIYAFNIYMQQVQNFDQRNNYRIRDYHRMDISVSHTKEKKHGIRTWTFGVYNAYNRMNTFYVFIDTIANPEINDQGGSYFYEIPVLKQRTLFPAIPFINYSFKF